MTAQGQASERKFATGQFSIGEVGCPVTASDMQNPSLKIRYDVSLAMRYDQATFEMGLRDSQGEVAIITEEQARLVWAKAMEGLSGDALEFARDVQRRLGWA